VFHYPGGLRIERSARALLGALSAARRDHGAHDLLVVAHSMGGLVARRAIQRADAAAASGRVPRFVTISTPWGGHEAATMGVSHLAYPVPAWHDMEPDSEFLRSLLATPLPAGTRHDLIFGFHSTGGIGLPDDNDGTVGVASQLVPAVQLAAHSVFGLPLDHAAILASPETARRGAWALAGE
jgi:pimeloyl-ACP methyl ester carboxylesterase